MSSFGVHDMMKVDASTAATLIEASRQRTDPPRLSPLAERLAALPVKPTYSPLVLEGLARFTDLVLVVVTGFVAFHLYLGTRARLRQRLRGHHGDDRARDLARLPNGRPLPDQRAQDLQPCDAAPLPAPGASSS